MERTESKIVQVAPSHENSKIQEQQIFGWNLQGRQEIHEKGNAEGGPDFLGGGYTIKTQVSTYVKLHFVRSLEMPNLERIKRLESEYDSMARPDYPALVPGGFPLVLFWTVPWLVLYIPFGYLRKKKMADETALNLRAKFESVAQELETLTRGKATA